MAHHDSTVDAIVEIPREPEQRQWTRRREPFASTVFFSRRSITPATTVYPRHRSEDGDPLDVLILVEEDFPGCRVRVRPIGVLLMHDEHGSDEKILGVPVADPRFAEVTDLGDLPPHWLAEVENFFETYKVLEGKTATVEGWKGTKEAERVLKTSSCG